MIEKLRMNIPIRFKNWAFWLGLLATMFTAVGLSPEICTSWDVLASELIQLLSNPYRLGCLVVAVIGVFNDPTTPGVGDSIRALNRKELGED